MTLATTALFAKGKTTLRNIGSWRVKETDRIAAMATELRKLGALVEEDGLHRRHAGTLATGSHRHLRRSTASPCASHWRLLAPTAAN